MRKSYLICFALFTLFTATTFGQSLALTFEEAEKQGIAYLRLDSLYKSAVHTDENLAVFKSPEEQAKLQQAYTKLLQDLGRFLKSYHFKWENPTRCFNRIYFEPDGNIAYFLVNFAADQITPEKEKEFMRLLRLFIQDYTFGLSADERFTQCSPVKYADS